MLTHRNLVANVAQTRPLIDAAGEDERIIAVLPFFHIYGLTVLMNQGLQWGGTVVTLPRFDLEDFLRTIQDHKITRAFVAPPILVALAKHPLVDQYDLSSLRLDPLRGGTAGRVAGARRRAAAAQGRRHRRHRGAGLRHDRAVAGLAHHARRGPRAARRHDRACRRARSATRSPTPSAGWSTPAPARTPRPASRGELWIRGPQVMKGYLNNAGGDRGHDRRRRLAAHRRRRRSSTRTAATPSSTGSRS